MRAPHSPASLTGGSLLIEDARVWTSASRAPSEPTHLVVANGRIVQIGDQPTSETRGQRLPGSEEMPRLDAGGRLLTAGFVNSHVHLSESVWLRVARAPAAPLQDALDDMFLSRGFTTVLDLASHPRETRDLVRRISRGDLRGPRILTAGTAIRPWRGLPYYVRDEIPALVRLLLPSPATAAGARAAVALQRCQGASLTKLFTGSYIARGVIRHMRPSVAAAAVSSAQKRGMPVFAHPSDATGVQIAIDAGVHALAHLPDSATGTAELLEQAAKSGMHLIPTLSMFARTVSPEESYLAPIREGLRHFIDAGGRVLFGTDVGYMKERDTRDEFSAMAECGMSPADILRSLTAEPAVFLSEPDRGHVRPGQRADLTLLDAETPSTTAFSRIHTVIREGHVSWSTEISS